MSLFKPIIAKDSKALRRLVLKAIRAYGPSVDLSHIDVGGIDNFDGLFKDTEFCGDVSQWNMAKAKSTNAMFAGTPFNGDVSNWNLKNLEEARGMFKDSHFNGDVSQWTVSNMIRLNKSEGMFENTYFAQDLTAWNIAAVWTEYRTTMLFLLNCKPWLGVLAAIKDQSNAKVSSDIGFLEESLEHCADMFGGQDRFGEYLTRAPFGLLHFDVCCVNATCPVGIAQEDFEWSRNLFTVGPELGLDNMALRQLCMDQLGARGANRVESFSVDGLLSQH